MGGAPHFAWAQCCSEEGCCLGLWTPREGGHVHRRQVSTKAPHGLFTSVSCPASPSCDPGYVASIMGRRRPLPRVRAQDQQLRAQAERQAVNFVVQGTQSPSGCLPWVLGSCRAEQHPQIIGMIVPAPVLSGSSAGSTREIALGAQQTLGTWWSFPQTTLPWTSEQGTEAFGVSLARTRARPGAQSLDSRPGGSGMPFLPGRGKTLQQGLPMQQALLGPAALSPRQQGVVIAHCLPLLTKTPPSPLSHSPQTAPVSASRRRGRAVIMGFLYHVPQAVPGRPQAAWGSGVIPSVTPWVTDGELRPPGPRHEAWRQDSTSCPQRGVLQQEGGEGPQLTGSGQLGLEAGWGSGGSPRVLQRGGHGSTEFRLSLHVLLGQQEAWWQLAGQLLGSGLGSR